MVVRKFPNKLFILISDKYRHDRGEDGRCTILAKVLNISLQKVLKQMLIEWILKRGEVC